MKVGVTTNNFLSYAIVLIGSICSNTYGKAERTFQQMNDQNDLLKKSDKTTF